MNSVTKKVPVSRTEFIDYFENIDLISNIFLLSQPEANKVWSYYIDPVINDFHKLNDNHWLYSNNINIGDWIDSYNNNNLQTVSKILKKVTRWPDEKKVYFFLNNDTIFETNWETFLECWDDFLCIDDDGPVLMCEALLNICIRFNPIGNMVYIEKK